MEITKKMVEKTATKLSAEEILGGKVLICLGQWPRHWAVSGGTEKWQNHRQEM